MRFKEAITTLGLLFVVFISGCGGVNKDKLVKDDDGSFLLTAPNGNKLKVTPYGEAMLRLQLAREGELFYADNHYEMVEHHDWPRKFELVETSNDYVISNGQLKLVVEKQSLKSEFYLNSASQPVLAEAKSAIWSDNQIKVSFNLDNAEHFTGLGHGYYARAESIDLKGQVIERNYGSQPIEQAPLVVPFYMSSKGYGIFLNSTFSNRFNFGKDDEYSFLVDDSGFGGRMDYFFIAGPKLTTVLDNYTQLTGRPRLPQKAMFGLQLSDKGHDHNSDTPSDMTWWQQKIKQHRAAGYPLDHIVNDNRWRAGGGKRCESRIEWDKERYPNPADYQRWLKDNGLVITLDFNRCIGQYSEGWQASFNLPKTGDIEFPQSAPDLTNDEFRQWFWQVFNEQALKPELQYPGDALWIDEFDEQGHAPKDMVLANGLSSAEMRNYWFFLISKALVEQGWDKAELNKRPFVWVRGMTAGAQRYATLWSGDIYPNYQDMAEQIRGMQLAGLAGFPYWGHDAGGFYDWNANLGPDEAMYQRWAMAFGSFAPIWKPHGMGQSRWPLDRDTASQNVATKFAQLRYRLMPYLYTAAKQAAQTGVPITRPMLLEHQANPLAWQFDLQYMWGDNVLVAPLTADTGNKQVWLPTGLWYDFATNQQSQGDKVLDVAPQKSELPIYVKAGAIIPARPYALSTAFIDKSKLTLNVYVGADGTYNLLEDDDVTEAHRLNGESQTTRIEYNQTAKKLIVNAVEGSYQNAPEYRDLIINFIGLVKPAKSARVNGRVTDVKRSNGVAVIQLNQVPVTQTLEVQL